MSSVALELIHHHLCIVLLVPKEPYSYGRGLIWNKYYQENRYPGCFLGDDHRSALKILMFLSPARQSIVPLSKASVLSLRVQIYVEDQELFEQILKIRNLSKKIGRNCWNWAMFSIRKIIYALSCESSGHVNRK